jgi:hypothetical protein
MLNSCITPVTNCAIVKRPLLRHAAKSPCMSVCVCYIVDKCARKAEHKAKTKAKKRDYDIITSYSTTAPPIQQTSSQLSYSTSAVGCTNPGMYAPPLTRTKQPLTARSMLAFRLHKQMDSSRSTPVINWSRVNVSWPCWAALAPTSVMSFMRGFPRRP